MALPSVSLTQVENALQFFSKIDLATAWAQLKSGDVRQELVVGEEAAEVLSAFFPEAKYAEDAMKILGLVIALKEAGIWAPGQPEDAAMQHAAGRETGTPQGHSGPLVLPGGTPDDPYGFDTRK